MSKKYFIINLASALIAVTIFSCSDSGRTGDAAEEAEVLPEDIVEMRYDQIKLGKIATDTMEVRYLFNTLKVNGKVTVPPQNYATVSTPYGGFISSTNFLPGDRVARGQVLAVIENQEFVNLQQDYLESENRLAYAEGEFKRHTELYKDEVYSEKNLQQVTADYNSLKAHVSALRQKLAMIGINPMLVREENITRAATIVSPITGYIKTVNVNIGKSVSPTDVLFEIVNTDKLFLELSLFEKDASIVQKGQKIRFFINNETEQHDAIIYQTAISVDADKSYKVYAEVESGCRNVLPGMYVNSVIEISGKKVPAVPSEAIVTFDDKDYIFIWVRDKEEKGIAFKEYRMIEVGKGMTEGDYTEVILPPGFDIRGSQIVMKGAYNLLSAKKNAGEMAC
jgi:membrane fusion protein, heavy metal efflux system